MVRLRPRRIEDAADSFKWRTDPELCRLDASDPVPYHYPEFRERFMLEINYPGYIGSVSVDLLNGRHIGECSVFSPDFHNNRAEVGIMLGEKDCWGSGYGREAFSMFVNRIFQDSTLDRLILRTLDWNTRAQKCFERCGFHPFEIALQGDYRFILMSMERQHLSR